MKLTKKQWAALKELEGWVGVSYKLLDAHYVTLYSLVRKKLATARKFYGLDFGITQKGIEALKNHI